jgi:hypothetical protein
VIEHTPYSDTVCRAAAALLALDHDDEDRVMLVTVEFVEGGRNARVTAFNCGSCERTHVRLEREESWHREDADERSGMT